MSENRIITLKFLENNNFSEYKYDLYPNKTNQISVPDGTRYIGDSMFIDIKLYVYPSPNELPNGGTLELFLFNPEVEQIDTDKFIMHRQDGVEAYFVKFSKNGRRYYAVSKDETIYISEEINPGNILDLFNSIYSNDVFYFDEAGTTNYNGSEIYWGGYILKAKADGNYLWLNAEMPWF
jgi:hypothetical protein